MALAAIILMLAPIQLLVLAMTRGRTAMALPVLFHRLVCAVLGIKVDVRGKPAPAARVVFISNHLSHLDIPAIGSVLRACFVAKDDIRGWPVFGPLAGLQQTVFISRDPRRAADAAPQLRRTLDAGHSLVLFPEGTTSDGSAVLPFKSSIFAMLVDPTLRDVVLQPMTIDLVAIDGRATANGGDRDGYAYHGDMQLLPHLLAFMRLSGARLRLTFHECLAQEDDRSRKVLAAQAHARVAQGLTRDDDVPPPSLL